MSQYFRDMASLDCDRDRIQTCNRLIRSQLLYSVELRGQSLYFCLNFMICDRDRIQTCNRLIRSQLLYSVELRGQSSFLFKLYLEMVTATGFKPVTG